MRNRVISIVSGLLLCAGILLAGFWAYRTFGAKPPIVPPASSAPIESPSEPPAPPSSAPQEESSSEAQVTPATVYPPGRMFVSNPRLDYRDGDIVLKVPRLALEAPVLGGFEETLSQKLSDGSMTTEERGAFFGNSEGDALLKKGLVLLNQASPPGPDIVNSNVSISGHRDIDGAEFYYIHTIVPGDRMSLSYGDREYTYEYVKTQIHKANDWAITFCQDESLLTLISCDPIGTSLNRIVVTARLVEITEGGISLPLAVAPPVAS